MNQTKHRIWALVTVALLGTTGCPDDNNPSDQMPDASPDQNNTDGSGDTSWDKGEEVGCRLLEQSPRTLSLESQQTQLSLTVECADAPSLEDMRVATGRQQELSLKTAQDALCEPDGEAQRCTVRVEGLSAPSTDSHIARESLLLSIGEQELATDVHWHLPIETLKQQQNPHILMTDEDVAGGSRATTLRKNEDGALEVIKASYVTSPLNGMEGRIRLSSVSLDTRLPTSSVEIGVNLDQMIGRRLQTVRHEDGAISTMWWGYDQTSHQFKGALLEFDASGRELRRESYASEAVEGAQRLVSIVDAGPIPFQRLMPNSEELQQSFALFVVGKNAAGQVVSHLAFGDEPAAQAFESGKFFGLADDDVRSEQFGQVKRLQRMSTYSTTNDDYVLFWSSSNKSTEDTLLLQLLPSYAIGDVPEQPVVELDTGFKTAKAIVQEVEPGVLVVFAQSEGKQRAMFTVKWDGEQAKVASVTTMQMPEHVDLVDEQDNNNAAQESDDPPSFPTVSGSILTWSWGRASGGGDSTNASGVRAAGHVRVFSDDWGRSKTDQQASDLTAPTQPVGVQWDEDGKLTNVWPLLPQEPSGELDVDSPLVMAQIANGRVLHVYDDSSLDPSACDGGACVIGVRQGVALTQGKAEPTVVILGRTLDDSHPKANIAQAFAHQAKQGTKARVVAVQPETASTFSIYEVGNTDDSSPLAAGSITLQINGQPLGAGLILHAVVNHERADGQEDVIFALRPSALEAQQSPEMQIVALSQEQIDRALGSDGPVVIQVPEPLRIALSDDAMPKQGRPFQFALLPRSSASSFGPINSDDIIGKASFEPTGGLDIIGIQADGAKSANLSVMAPDPNSTTAGYQLVKTLELAFPEEDGSPAGAKLALLETAPALGSNSILVKGKAGHVVHLTRSQGQVQASTQSVPSSLEPDSYKDAIYEVGDFNGDAIQDLAIYTDFALSEGASRTGQHVVFGDGLGGLLPAAYDTLAGPDQVWEHLAIRCCRIRRVKIRRRYRSRYTW